MEPRNCPLTWNFGDMTFVILKVLPPLYHHFLIYLAIKCAILLLCKSVCVCLVQNINLHVLKTELYRIGAPQHSQHQCKCPYTVLIRCISSDSRPIQMLAPLLRWPSGASCGVCTVETCPVGTRKDIKLASYGPLNSPQINSFHPNGAYFELMT